MKPLVTVVVPVYNRDRELSRALCSIQRQTYAHFECLVIDDASTMPVEHIVRGLRDDRFRYMRRAINGGPSAARFTGYAAMRGSFLAAVDSDDEAYPHMLASAVTHLERTPSVAGVGGMTARAVDGRPRVRVRGGTAILTPAQYRTTPQLPDCAGVVRRCVVEEWLAGDNDYYALEVSNGCPFIFDTACSLSMMYG